MWLFSGVGPPVGHVYSLSGRAVEAISLLEKAIEQAAVVGLVFNRSLNMGWLAHAQLVAGHPADASRTASQALALARQHHERGHEAWLQGITAEIAAQTEPTHAAAAERAYRAGLAIGTELGMRPLVAHCHVGLGKLCRPHATVGGPEPLPACGECR
jgi:hypothetical protein